MIHLSDFFGSTLYFLQRVKKNGVHFSEKINSLLCRWMWSFSVVVNSYMSYFVTFDIVYSFFPSFIIQLIRKKLNRNWSETVIQTVGYLNVDFSFNRQTDIIIDDFFSPQKWATPSGLTEPSDSDYSVDYVLD